MNIKGERDREKTREDGEEEEEEERRRGGKEEGGGGTNEEGPEEGRKKWQSSRSRTGRRPGDNCNLAFDFHGCCVGRGTGGVEQWTESYRFIPSVHPSLVLRFFLPRPPLSFSFILSSCLPNHAGNG